MSSLNSRGDWHGTSPRSPYHSTHNSHPSSYESQQQPPAEMRSPYDYPPPRMASRSGGHVPSTPPPPPPPHESYWYEGRSSEFHRRRPPPTEAPGWHYHSGSQEYEPPYEHSMPPPPHQSYPYPHPQDMHQAPVPPVPGRRDTGGRGAEWPSPPDSNSKRSTNPNYPPYYARKVSHGSSSAPPSYQSRAPSQSRSPKKHRDEKAAQNKKNGEKGDPLDLLAKVSTAMVHDGSKKQGGRDPEKSADQPPPPPPPVPKEVRAPYPASPPREKTGHRSHSHHATPSSLPKPREVTPTVAPSPEHSHYYPPRGHPQEPSYYSQHEYYTRHEPRNPTHGHHYAHDHPQPHYYSHPGEPGWGSHEGPNASPPPLVERSPSFEGQDVDRQHPYYQPPPPTPPSFEPPYEHSTRGPPPPPSHWNEYPSHPGSGPGNPGAREATPPSTPPHHVYPPPRWSYEFGRGHREHPPPGQPRRIIDEPPRPPMMGGESSSFSSKPHSRGSYHMDSGPPPPPPYTPPHHSYPYHEHGPHPRTPGRDPSKSSEMYSPYTYVQQPHAEEKTILRKKFSWKHYPELEQFLITHRDEYLRHSNMNYTAEQKHYNNWLTDRLLEVAEENNYAFDPEDFNFVAIRDRIRCYYKSYVQTARKRGIALSHEEGKEGNKKKPRIPTVITTTTPAVDESSNDDNQKSNVSESKTDKNDAPAPNRDSERFSSAKVSPGRTFR